MKNKCTLIVDGNWLCMSRMAVIGRFEMEYARPRLKKRLKRIA